MNAFVLITGLWTLLCAVAFLAGCYEAVSHFSQPVILRWQSGERPWPQPPGLPIAPTLAQEQAP